MKNITFDFKGKNAIVTGGAQGIGLEITKQFLLAGANVAVWDFSPDALASAEKELGEFKNQLKLQRVDISDRNHLRQTVSELPYKIHALINNAGITRDKSFKKMNDDDFDSVIRTNLTGIYNVTKALQESFDEASGQCRIINMASVVGLYGNFGQTNYAAAKAGVIGMTKTLAKELGRKGYTVNAVAPGFIMTKMTQAMPPEVLQDMAKKVPVGRLGTVEDIAAACLFLASDAASYINGTVISVDGGIVV